MSRTLVWLRRWLSCVFAAWPHRDYFSPGPFCFAALRGTLAFRRLFSRAALPHLSARMRGRSASLRKQRSGRLARLPGRKKGAGRETLLRGNPRRAVCAGGCGRRSSLPHGQDTIQAVSAPYTVSKFFTSRNSFRRQKENAVPGCSVLCCYMHNCFLALKSRSARL